MNWFRKNPHLLSDATLRNLFAPDSDTHMSTHVLDALGGVAWLVPEYRDRNRTDETELRRYKSCQACGARDPLVKLSVCNGCRKVYYWYVGWTLGWYGDLKTASEAQRRVRKRAGRHTSRCPRLVRGTALAHVTVILGDRLLCK